MDAAQHDGSLASTRVHSATVQRSATPGISLILPAFNEQEVIEQAIREADEALACQTADYEILVVDDGSTDDTRKVAQRAAASRPHVRVIAHDRNCGYGAALRTGFRAARKDYVGFTDADCQFDVREMNRLVMLLRSYDIACGYRIDRQDHWLRLLYSRGYNFLVGLLLGTRVRDCDCAFKLFRREALDSLLSDTDGFLVNAEMLTAARLQGRTVVEVGVTHRARPRGQSTVSVWHTIPVFKSLLRYWWSSVLFPSRAETGTAITRGWSRGTTMLALLFLIGLSLAMFFRNLGYPLVEPDESRYAQIGLEMIESGNYIVPHLQGQPYLDKPPLLYWVTAASFRLWGNTEFAARLPSAMAALLTVLATFWMGARLIGHRAALLGALMLFLSLGFVLSGRFLIMDGLLTLFTTTCILSSLLAVRGPSLRWNWWILSALACALGIMTKGPVALILALPPLVAVQWLVREQARVRWAHWLAFLAVVLAVTAPWFVLIGRAQGEFAAHFLWKHHVLRFVRAFNHQEPLWYYLPVLFVGMFPSSLMLAPVVAFLVGRSARVRRLRTPELGCLLLAALWIVGFFSISSCKLPTYILPAVPLLCLVQACMVSEVIGRRCPEIALSDLAQRLPYHATSLALVTGAVLAVIDLVLRPQQSMGRVIDYGVIGLALSFLGYQFSVRRRWPARPANWAIACSVSLVIMAFGFQKFMPDFAQYRSISANAARLQHQVAGPPAPVAYLEHEADGSSFYLSPEDVHQFAANQIGDFKQFLLAHPRVLVVADRWRADALQQELGKAVAITPTSGARGRLFVASLRPAAVIAAQGGSNTRR